MLSYDTLAVTVAEADDYAAARGKAWDGDSPTKTAALRRGQDYIAATYNGRWAVEFDDTDAPDGVKYAIIEAAVRELATPGALLPDSVPSRRVLAESVGPLSVTYANDRQTQPVIPAIDGHLRGLILPDVMFLGRA
jgi:hypothetical protein